MQTGNRCFKTTGVLAEASDPVSDSGTHRSTSDPRGKPLYKIKHTSLKRQKRHVLATGRQKPKGGSVGPLVA